jgi:hypothetical protein
MRLLVGGSLVACLIAVAVILSGQTAQVHELIGDGKPASVERTPLGRARAIQQTQSLAQHLRVVQLEFVTSERSTAAQLTAALKRAEPAAPTGASLNRGGVQVYVRGTVVGVCGRQSTAPRMFRCAAWDRNVRRTVQARGRQLPQAQRAAARAATGTSDAASSGSDSDGLSAIEKARGAADALGR